MLCLFDDRRSIALPQTDHPSLEVRGGQVLPQRTVGWEFAHELRCKLKVSNGVLKCGRSMIEHQVHLRQGMVGNGKIAAIVESPRIEVNQGLGFGQPLLESRQCLLWVV